MTFANRETWLNQALDVLRDGVFAPLGITIPPISISVGLPHARNQRDVLIQLHPGTASADGKPQVFVNPIVSDGGVVLARLSGVLNGAYGHGDMVPFDAAASALCMDVLGPYPQAALRLPDYEKQPTLMIRMECPKCGYLARATQRWISASGPLHCPCAGNFRTTAMKVCPSKPKQPKI